jgi:hypothetical protein
MHVDVHIYVHTHLPATSSGHSHTVARFMLIRVHNTNTQIHPEERRREGVLLSVDGSHLVHLESSKLLHISFDGV